MMGKRQTYEGPEGAVQYGRIKTGTKTLEDAVLNLGAFNKAKNQFGNKRFILKAIETHDIKLMREISNYFYNTSGIYKTACDYYAFLYRYDWYIYPEVLDDTANNDKILKDWNNILNYLDNTHIKKLAGDISLEVIRSGAYYGYIIDSSDSLVLQQLPANYCRSLFNVGDQPVVDFNMKFFDEQFPDLTYRTKILGMFPADFQKGYRLYKTHKLPADTISETYGSWYTLDPGTAVKFSFNNHDAPLFINAIPAILDLDAAQDLDRRKQMQQLLKIVIQKLPLDKNGDLIFDVDEATDIHNNAVEMLSHAIGVDVLTTFADIQVEDMADDNTSTTTDDLERVERTVYNSLGISKDIFNADGNIALTNSILADESTMRTLLFQLSAFLDKVVQSKCANRKKYGFRFCMMETTQYNYQTLAKMYKEDSQIGFSMMLPQVALGHSQSSILHTAYFENEVLNLSELMVPPLQSSVMSAENVTALKASRQSKSSSGSSDNEVGRPEKEDNEKSEKTLQNRESMS